MKLRLLLLLGGSLVLLSAQAQKAKKSTAFAITGSTKNSSNWSEVRLVDIASGEELKNIYQPTQEPAILNAHTGKPVVKKDGTTRLDATPAPSPSSAGEIRRVERLTNVEDMSRVERLTNVEEFRRVEGDKVVVLRRTVRSQAPLSYDKPFATKSAAMAYDKKHERLYYTPMGINQLRYIDLKAKTPKVYYFEEEPFGVLSGPHDIPKQITRMVIAADGNGYALTNDGKHLIRFTTGRKQVITDLGTLDDAEGNTVSVHHPGGYGGDLIADKEDNLYLITANRKVFRIGVDSKIATYKGTIQGLPRGYTTNGAMVEEGSTVIVCSSNSTQGYYKFDLHTLQAEKVSGEASVFNASDLANGVLANTKKKKEPKPEEATPAVKEEEVASAAEKATIQESIRNGNITVYPNPVMSGERVKIYLAGQPAGRYQAQLLDISGKLISSRDMTVNSELQVEEFRLPANITKGNYLLKVAGENSKGAIINKLLVQ